MRYLTRELAHVHKYTEYNIAECCGRSKFRTAVMFERCSTVENLMAAKENNNT